MKIIIVMILMVIECWPDQIKINWLDTINDSFKVCIYSEQEGLADTLTTLQFIPISFNNNILNNIFGEYYYHSYLGPHRIANIFCLRLYYGTIQINWSYKQYIDWRGKPITDWIQYNVSKYCNYPLIRPGYAVYDPLGRRFKRFDTKSNVFSLSFPWIIRKKGADILLVP